jgi:hypothetical protein
LKEAKIFRRIHCNNDKGVFVVEEKLKLNQLECKVRRLLANKEAKWRLKNMTIWIESGDENINFSDHFTQEKIEYNMGDEG